MHDATAWTQIGHASNVPSPTVTIPAAILQLDKPIVDSSMCAAVYRPGRVVTSASSTADCAHGAPVLWAQSRARERKEGERVLRRSNRLGIAPWWPKEHLERLQEEFL